jgi:hypothetical protein
MPENWRPGMPLKIPDPNDPTKFLEITPDLLEVVAEVPVAGPPPKIQADLGGEPLQTQPKGKKKKKKKIQAPVEEFNILNQLNFFTQEIESARKEEKSRN